MKKITLLLALIICCNWVFSNPIDTITAKIVAANFWRQNNIVGIKNGKTLRVRKEVPDFRVEQTDSLFQHFYILTAVDAVGFVIVSADDQATPILGYSMEDSFEVQNMPPNLKDWLMGYEQAIQAANASRCSDEIRNEWGHLLAGENLPAKSTTSVAPLLTTNWDQGWPYNLLCPYDYEEDDYTVTGCVATAMAQVMKYWEHPVIGSGSHTYTHSTYGTMSANYEAETMFNWNEMLNNYSETSSYTIMQVTAIATLMKMCGVSVDMNYGVESQNGSSAITTAAALLDTDPLAQTYPSAENALKTFFDYSPNLIGIAKDNYSNSQWVNILKNELDSDRVVLYSGSGAGGGHAFVCDGYNNNNYFHFNWGWSGSSNGYYSVNSLTPPSYNFSQTQQAVIGITPANQTNHPNYDLVMYNALTTSDTSYYFGPSHSITINCAVANVGSATFNGYLTAIVYDMDGNVVAEVPSYTSISTNHFVNKSFVVQGGLPLGPGVYYAIITSSTNLYDPTTYQIVRDDLSNINFASFFIEYSSEIETYSDFYLSEDPIYSGQTLTVNVTPANATSTSYSGSVMVALLSLTGSFIQSIHDTTFATPIPAMSYAVGGIDFTGTITAPAGDYMLVLIHKPQGSSSWYYAGSTYYQNPVRITIHELPLPDIYEVNNTAAMAYSLVPDFSDDWAEVNTNGANFHSITDEDYYKIVLPAGYSYLAVPVLQDYYYNDDISYTVDAKVYFSVNNTNSWTGPIDLDDNILTYMQNECGATLNDGGTVYFKVLPTFQGDIGTYSLHVVLSRSINPDQYEPNNTSATAYNLGSVNTSSANYNLDANFHITTDNDYYKINLPAGYSYTINANIQTSYNNTAYSADATFATSQNGSSWSSSYSNSMPVMTMSNGGTLYFRVLPYTNNEIGTYKLQISITRSGGIQPDQYEPNNTASTAYNLGTVNSNSASYTVNANFHVTSDNDYYKIDLPSGYSYTINANILNSSNNSSYTANAQFATSQTGSAWSSNYYNTMPALTTSGGSTLYFRVLPVTSGEIGTYSLQISVTRTVLMEPDMYEPNNTVSTAYNLGAVNDNSASYTLNANFHVTTDNDYYKIDLPLGYSYTINANILNSSNNSSYTANAQFAASPTGGTWTPDYSSSMPELTINNGGTLYFRVLPVTSSEIGTYSLQISVTRTVLVEPDMYEPNNTFSTAYNLGAVDNNSASYTLNANFHVTTDNDYYKIDLPSGYSYAINANVLNSSNNSSYTANAQFATSQTGVTWTPDYSGSMPELTISDGVTLYFRVLPVTSGEIGTYSLHISVTRTVVIEPDIYEPNNTVNTSYLLATINDPSSSIVANASFHTTSDVDYYKIDFPVDYTYHVDAALFDCTNDPNCSVDAKIAVSVDGTNWSSFYEISVPSMTIEHGGRLYYHVVPQQTAAMGTYQLLFTVSRETGIQDNEFASIRLYPNPVTDHLIINCSNEIQLDGIEIYDIAGRLIQIVEKDCRVINTSQLSKGTYLLRLFTSEGEITKKFLK